MKQDILCPECAQEKRTRYPTDNPFPGEYMKFVKGTARKDYKCDLCDKKIGKQHACTAFSGWTTRGRIPYYPWESEYINIEEDGS